MPNAEYAAHDQEYRRRHAAGLPGWDGELVLAEHLTLLSEVFIAPHFPSSGRMLELGCGAGDRSLWAAERGYEVVGIDISPFAIEWAIEKASERGMRARFLVGDVRDLGEFPDQSFDIVLDGHCLHCIIGPDRVAVLREAYRVLRADGIFHVASMCGDPTDPELLGQFDPPSRCLHSDGVARRYLGTPSSIEQELTDAGFMPLQRRVLPRRHAKELDLVLIDASRAQTEQDPHTLT